MGDIDARVVDARDVVTAGGGIASLELTVDLLRRWFTASVATTVVEWMEHRPDVSVERS